MLPQFLQGVACVGTSWLLLLPFLEILNFELAEDSVSERNLSYWLFGLSESLQKNRNGHEENKQGTKVKKNTHALLIYIFI